MFSSGCGGEDGIVCEWAALQPRTLATARVATNQLGYKWLCVRCGAQTNERGSARAYADPYGPYFKDLIPEEQALSLYYNKLYLESLKASLQKQMDDLNKKLGIGIK